MEEDKERTKRAGFCCHLTKPVKAEELYRALALVESMKAGRLAGLP